MKQLTPNSNLASHTQHCAGALAPDLFSSTIQVNEGENLFWQGYENKHVYLIESGVVQLEHVSTGGRRRILTLTNAGQTLGADGIMAADVALYSTKTLTSCQLKKCEIGIFRTSLFDHPELISTYLGWNQERWIHFLKHTTSDLPPRYQLVKTFQAYAAVLGVGNKNGWIRLGVNISQQELSDFSGVPLRTLCRILAEFKKENLIGLNGLRYSISPKLWTQYRLEPIEDLNQ